MMDCVYIETFPDHYVGPRVSVTIRIREKDAKWATIKSLQKRIALDIDMINTIGGEVVDGINHTNLGTRNYEKEGNRKTIL